MVSKKIELEGYGSIAVCPIKFKMPEAHWVDTQNRDVKYTIQGKGKGVYLSADGNEISRSELRRKYVVDGREIFTDRLKITKIVKANDISVTDAPVSEFIMGNTDVLRFALVTDNTKIKETLNSGNTIIAKNVVLATGGMPYRMVFSKIKLPDESEHMVAFAVRGNFYEALVNFTDSPIDIGYDDTSVSELSEALGV